MAEWIGKTIGNVRIEKYLARGGMAEVYLGTHVTLERQVAVKVMHTFIEDDRDALQRFQREARVVAGLRHPNIVQIFDFNTYEGHPYIVMEYLNGPSLDDFLRELLERNKRMSFDQIAFLLKPVSSALDYAHAQGVIHRDIKPGNILLRSRTVRVRNDGSLNGEYEPILTDFGLVRITNAASLTASGMVSGTPAFMAPEQARGEKVDHRTDIYSLGVVLYEMVSGHVPFEADSTMAVILKHLNEPPPPIEGIAAPIQAVISRALEKLPDRRYQSALEMSDAFDQAISLSAEPPTMISAPQKITFGAAAAQQYTSIAPPPSASGMTPPPQYTGMRPPPPAARITPQPQPTRVAPPQPKKPARVTLMLIGGLLAVCVCLSAVLLGGLGYSAATGYSIFGGLGSSIGGMDPSVGVLRFQDGTAPLDRITISASLAAPATGSRYEAWLISDSGEQRRSLGLLSLNPSGQYVLAYVDPQSHNLLDGFSRMEITVEPDPDTSPNPSGQVAYSSALPFGALMHIRHLIVGIDETPGKIGMADGLVNDTTLIKKSADAMLEAFTKNDPKAVQADAEAIVNLIVGKQDATAYKDWDGDGQINDPGDGFGLLLNGNQAGYISGVIDHAKLAGEAGDAPAMINMHSQHVITSAQNVELWAAQLKAIAIRLAQGGSGQNTEADIRQVVVLANQMLEGIDINGDEKVDPIPGEGGADTAYEHANYMADMPILPGKDQVPAAGR